MRDEHRKIPYSLTTGAVDRDGVGRSGGLEADREENHLAIRIGTRNREHIERGIDEPDIATPRPGAEKIPLSAGHAQHVAERAERQLGSAGDLDRLVDIFDRCHTDRASGSVCQTDIGRQ